MDKTNLIINITQDDLSKLNSDELVRLEMQIRAVLSRKKQEKTIQDVNDKRAEYINPDELLTTCSENDNNDIKR